MAQVVGSLGRSQEESLGHTGSFGRRRWELLQLEDIEICEHRSENRQIFGTTSRKPHLHSHLFLLAKNGGRSIKTNGESYLLGGKFGASLTQGSTLGSG